MTQCSMDKRSCTLTHTVVELLQELWMFCRFRVDRRTASEATAGTDGQSGPAGSGYSIFGMLGWSSIHLAVSHICRLHSMFEGLHDLILISYFTNIFRSTAVSKQVRSRSCSGDRFPSLIASFTNICLDLLFVDPRLCREGHGPHQRLDPAVQVFVVE